MINFLLELAGWSVDAVSTTFVTALRWAVRISLVMAATVMVFLVASGLGAGLLATILLWLLIIEVVVFALVFFPLVTFLKMNQKIKEFSEAAWQSLASLLLWLLTIGISLTVFFWWGEAKYAPLLVVVIMITALGHWVCDMRFSAKAAVYRNWLVVGAILLLLALPSLGSVILKGAKTLDTGLREKFWPEMVAYHPDLLFFDPTTGQARYW
ncbi:MAG: hypothetical protein AAB566_00820, partial [Patescibacteria group bacterium]